jgi:hypothetical protein
VGWITKVQHITNENFDDKNWTRNI